MTTNISNLPISKRLEEMIGEYKESPYESQFCTAMRMFVSGIRPFEAQTIENAKQEAKEECIKILEEIIEEREYPFITLKYPLSPKGTLIEAINRINNKQHYEQFTDGAH